MFKLLLGVNIVMFLHGGISCLYYIKFYAVVFVFLFTGIQVQEDQLSLPV